MAVLLDCQPQTVRVQNSQTLSSGYENLSAFFALYHYTDTLQGDFRMFSGKMLIVIASYPATGTRDLIYEGLSQTFQSKLQWHTSTTASSNLT